MDCIPVVLLYGGLWEATADEQQAHHILQCTVSIFVDAFCLVWNVVSSSLIPFLLVPINSRFTANWYAADSHLNDDEWAQVSLEKYAPMRMRNGYNQVQTANSYMVSLVWIWMWMWWLCIIARRHTRQNQSKCEKFSVLRLPTHLFWVSVEWKLFCTHINGNHLNIRWKPNQILSSRMSILRLNFNQMYTLKESELNAEHNVVAWQYLNTAKILHGICSRDLLNTTMSWIIEVCHQAQFLTLKYLYALTLYDCGFLFHSAWEHINLMTPEWEKNHHLFELWICSRNGYYNGYIPRSVAGESSITNFSQSNYRFVWLVFELEFEQQLFKQQ